MQDQELRGLCWEAMHEKDLNKLLTLFLELDQEVNRWNYFPRSAASTDNPTATKPGTD